jgi:prepilin-type N-terminal cleavage/methylation domain-containing protein
MKTQQGFTLVEIAIVLVIIGLLLGGVLKGQEIITNAKVKNLENSVDGLAAAVYSYQDRYRAYPGDDARAKRFTGVTKIGDDDGVIEGKFNDAGQANESSLLWLHLRNAGLVSGDTNENNNSAYEKPRNSFNGVMGAATSSSGADKVQAISGTYIGFTNIPNAISVILETRADDNDNAKGSVQSDIDYKDNSKLHEIYFAI